MIEGVGVDQAEGMPSQDRAVVEGSWARWPVECRGQAWEGVKLVPSIVVMGDGDGVSRSAEDEPVLVGALGKQCE